MIRRLLSILFVALAVFSAPALAATRAIISAEADVDVFEADPNRNRNSSGYDILSSGTGRGLAEGRFISYVRFDLSSLPSSSLLSNVSIESGELRLLAAAFGLAGPEDRFFVTVSSCPDNDWSEASMTWNSRACPSELQGEDSIVIKGTELPAVYAWDVTRGVAEAHKAGKKKITFTIDAFVMEKWEENPREPVPGRRFGPEPSVGFVRFWSRERSSFGLKAIPTLLVSYSSSRTSFVNFLGSLLAFLSAIGVAVGLYQTFHKLQKKKFRRMGKFFAHADIPQTSARRV